MDKLKQLIRKIIKEQQEYDAPEEIVTALEDKIQMNPIERFVEKFKAVNSIPPSYRVFLHNGQFFDIVYESFSLMIKVQGREYYIADLDERSEAIEEINRLLTLNQMVPDEAGEDEDGLEDLLKPPPKKKPTGRPPAGGGAGTTPPPPPPADEPDEEPMV